MEAPQRTPKASSATTGTIEINERLLLRHSLFKELNKLQKDLEHGTISEFDGIIGIIKFLRKFLEHIEVV